MNLVEQIESIRRSAETMHIQGYYCLPGKVTKPQSQSVATQLAQIERILKEAGEKGVLRNDLKKMLGVDKNRFGLLCLTLAKQKRYIVKLAKDAWGPEYGIGPRVMYYAGDKT